MSSKHLVMLGTAGLMGGIASVIDVYRIHGLMDRWRIVFIKTHCEGGSLAKLRIAAMGLGRFLSLLLMGRIACVHVHCSSHASFWRKSFFILAATAWKVPVILHLHGGDFADFYASRLSPVGRFLARYLFARAARIIVLASRWKDWVHSITNNPNVLVIYNPVLRLPVDAHACAVETQKKPTTILSLGRLTGTKGTYDLLRAVSRIVAQVPDVTLLLAGDGEHDEVKRYAVALGIESRVQILGWIAGKEKAACLAHATVFVLPSYFEGLPMSILEAMAAGIPVVTTPVGGIPDAVQNGEQGLLIEPGNIPQLADALLRILTDEALQRRLGHAGKQTIAERFDADCVVPQVDALYASLQLVQPAPGIRQESIEVESA